MSENKCCATCDKAVQLGFIRQKYSGSYCLECSAEVKEGEY